MHASRSVASLLQVGTAVRQLAGRPESSPPSPSHVRLDVLLRSGLGQAVLVANLVGEPSAQPAGARIGRLTLGVSPELDLLSRFLGCGRVSRLVKPIGAAASGH